MTKELTNRATNINFNSYETLKHIVHNERLILMRIFLIVLILIFNLQSLSKADDIRDFEIDGLSIGDSILVNYNIDEIENNSLKRLISTVIKIIELNNQNFYLDKWVGEHKFTKNSLKFDQKKATISLKSRAMQI